MFNRKEIFKKENDMIQEMLRDENGKASSSRLVLMIMVALFCFIVMTGKIVDEMVFTILNSVLLLCLGGASVRGTVSNLKGGT